MAELKEITIEKDFVPYEIALQLQELGFDEDGLGMYSKNGSVLPLVPYTSEDKAILFSQAFRFFRDRYHLIGCIDFHASYKNYMYNIKDFEYITHRTRIETYEEAEIECLKKLIEIAKEQNVKYI